MDQRTAQLISSTDSQTPLYFHYDQQGHLIQESRSGKYSSVREYVYIDDMPLAQINSDNSIDYLHPNHIGVVQKMTNAAGALVNDLELDAFGNVQSNTSGTPAMKLRFPGQYADADSGLYHNGFRDYDPTIGRYPQADPLGLAAGVSLYGYVGQNPVNWVDPWGLVSLNYLPLSTPSLRQAMQQYNPPNVYSIAGHGSPEGIYNSAVPNPIFGTGNLMLPSMLANDIQQDPGYSSGEPVLLLACSAGNGGNSGASVAQTLAKTLNTNVIASDQPIIWQTQTDSNGNVSHFNTSVANGGQMYIFTPQGLKIPMGSTYMLPNY